MQLFHSWTSQLRLLFDYLDSSPSTQANPKLYQLKNPSQHLWNQAPPELEPCTQIEAEKSIPVLFVHGMEYQTPKCVVEDLIRPFEQQARLTLSGNPYPYRFYFVCWNSSIICATSPKELQELRQQLGLPLFVLLARKYWHRFYLGLEERAETVASFMLPIYLKMLEQDMSYLRPIVVSHSLGSYIWSLVTNRMLELWPDCPSPADWHSFQPGISYDAYAAKGEFPLIAPHYARSPASLKIWYSKLDIVLSIMFPAVKGKRAMGQIGAKYTESIDQIDMTRFALEAHGIAKIGINNRSMWDRVGHLIGEHLNGELLMAKNQLSASQRSIPNFARILAT